MSHFLFETTEGFFVCMFLFGAVNIAFWLIMGFLWRWAFSEPIGPGQTY